MSPEVDPRPLVGLTGPVSAGVLLGDLAVSGFLLVHGAASAHPPDRQLLARVLHGLRRL